MGYMNDTYGIDDSSDTSDTDESDSFLTFITAVPIVAVFGPILFAFCLLGIPFIRRRMRLRRMQRARERDGLPPLDEETELSRMWEEDCQKVREWEEEHCFDWSPAGAGV
ncbi:hypothetical protein VTL71DRAFT_13586 [Oculimacula yallundae]|uniref:Uncharacterized protein n=1 Tax=Oculimacula yallundae TaxID=86028 RepID=A0ABR4CKW2_9HELO